MKQFAKLFETKRGQILVKRDDNDEGAPEVRFYIDLDECGLGVCSFALSWEDCDGGREAADKAFAEADEATAQRFSALPAA